MVRYGPLYNRRHGTMKLMVGPHLSTDGSTLTFLWGTVLLAPRVVSDPDWLDHCVALTGPDLNNQSFDNLVRPSQQNGRSSTWQERMRRSYYRVQKERERREYGPPLHGTKAPRMTRMGLETLMKVFPYNVTILTLHRVLWFGIRVILRDSCIRHRTLAYLMSTACDACLCRKSPSTWTRWPDCRHQKAQYIDITQMGTRSNIPCDPENARIRVWWRTCLGAELAEQRYACNSLPACVELCPPPNLNF